MIIKHLAIIIILLLSPLIGFAQANSNSAKAGVIYGYTVPDADNTKPHRSWGITGTAMINANFSLGGYYVLADKQEGSGGRYFETSTHGIALTYHIPSGKGDTFYGVRAGITKLETADTTTGDEFVLSPYHWGVAAGYDYAVASFWSVGFEGSYISYDNSETTNAGVTYSEDKFSTISFALTSKLLF